MSVFHQVLKENPIIFAPVWLLYSYKEQWAGYTSSLEQTQLTG
jgi:hypothetical protein